MVDWSKKSAFIMVGYPGSGKSTVARKICDTFHCHYLSSDEIREKVFQKLRFDLMGDEAMAPIREQAYQLMYDTAVTLLKQGEKVVLDATHLEPKRRNPVLAKLVKAAKRDSICFVLVTTPREEIDKRMKALAHVAHNSEESLYDGWKRITGYFEKNEKKGLISWPDTKTSKIDCVTHEELTAHLVV